jgi:Family of unknown function (DUF6221)
MPELRTDDLPRPGRGPAAARRGSRLLRRALLHRRVAVPAGDRSAARELRDFLAARTAEVTAAAEAERPTPTFADAGAALANCDSTRRLIEAWDALAGWAEDPEADPAGAYRVAADGLLDGMRLLALRFSGHPDFPPAWRAGTGRG